MEIAEGRSASRATSRDCLGTAARDAPRSIPSVVPKKSSSLIVVRMLRLRSGPLSVSPRPLRRVVTERPDRASRLDSIATPAIVSRSHAPLSRPPSPLPRLVPRRIPRRALSRVRATHSRPLGPRHRHSRYRRRSPERASRALGNPPPRRRERVHSTRHRRRRSLCPPPDGAVAAFFCCHHHRHRARYRRQRRPHDHARRVRVEPGAGDRWRRAARPAPAHRVEQGKHAHRRRPPLRDRARGIARTARRVRRSRRMDSDLSPGGFRGGSRARAHVLHNEQLLPHAWRHDEHRRDLRRCVGRIHGAGRRHLTQRVDERLRWHAGRRRQDDSRHERAVYRRRRRWAALHRRRRQAPRPRRDLDPARRAPLGRVGHRPMASGGATRARRSPG